MVQVTLKIFIQILFTHPVKVKDKKSLKMHTKVNLCKTIFLENRQL